MGVEKPTYLRFAAQVISTNKALGGTTERYSPKSSGIVQRHHCYFHSQKNGEGVKEFVAEPWKLADQCEFGAELEINLRDRIVHGINNDMMRRRLLEEPKLTFQNAVMIFTGMEAAALGSDQITTKTGGGNDGMTAPAAVNRVTTPGRKQTTLQVCQRALLQLPTAGTHR